jgi:fructokinase
MTDPEGPLLASLEFGGTKALVAVGRDPLAPLRRARIPTRDPETTLGEIRDFFLAAGAELGPVAALGVASFGPIDIRRESPDWGRMGRTTKPGWPGAVVGGLLERSLGCPVALDTDVNGAALAEARWGAGRDVASLAYLTVGTGIGGGLIVRGRPIHGAMHPEMGHVRLQRHPDDRGTSVCGYHPDCAEGLASGPAIKARFGGEEVGEGHPFRAIVADYLGQLCATLVLVASPHRIVIGGGVMTASGLHGEVEAAMELRLNGYVEGPSVVPPALGEEAGLAGGFALAQDVLEGSPE